VVSAETLSMAVLQVSNFLAMTVLQFGESANTRSICNASTNGSKTIIPVLCVGKSGNSRQKSENEEICLRIVNCIKKNFDGKLITINSQTVRESYNTYSCNTVGPTSFLL